MAVLRRELPHIIKPSLTGDALARAIQENFDALSGEVGLVNRTVSEATSADSIKAVAAEVVYDTVSPSDDELRQQLADAGVGAEDGSPPPQVSSLRAIAGIGNWFMVIWDGVTNTSGVTYEVHVHTTSGFTPAANTKVGTFTVPGGTDKTGSFLVRDFPTGHVLDGTGSDPVSTTVTYYAKIVPVDGDGAGVASAQVSSSAMVIDASSVIAAGTVVTNMMVANSIHGDRISGGTITADKLSVGSLDAISINAGTLTSGSLNGLTITGGTIRTAATGQRLEINSGNIMQFYNASGPTVQLNSPGSALNFGSDSGATVVFGVPVTLDSTLDHNGSTLGFYGVTPTTRQSMSDFTNNTGGTANDIVAAVSGTGDDTTINNNFSDLATKMNNLLAKLRLTGIIS